MSSARRLAFEYPSDMDVMWTPRAPEFACAANAVSLLMPSIEPYFVRSIRAAAANVPDHLRAEVDVYLFQEAQHHKQHVIFNALLIKRYPLLAPLDRLMKQVFGALSSSMSVGFNVAFAACAETVAYSAARWAAGRRQELFTGADDDAATLFLWHLAEEVEHKSAAFDVYLAHLNSDSAPRGERHNAFDDSKDDRSPPSRRSATQLLQYLIAMVSAIVIIVPFILVGTATLVTYERRLFWPVAWFRLFRWSVMFAFEGLTNLGMSLFPSHHPTDFVDPLWFKVWLAEFDAENGTMPVWNATPSPDMPAISSADRSEPMSITT